MRVIHKFPLDIIDQQSVEMPAEAKILCVKEQEGDLFIWAMVDPHEELETPVFRVIAAGAPIDDHGNLEYIDTVAMSPAGGRFVWHVFKVGKDD